MDPEFESTFEIVPPKVQPKKKLAKQQTVEGESVENQNALGTEIQKSEGQKKAMQRAEKKRRIDHEKILYEFLAILGFTSAMMFLCLSDMVEVSFIKSPEKQKEAEFKKLALMDFNSEDTFKSRVLNFMAEVKVNGRAHRPARKMEDFALFYLLSEKQPIDVAFRREWVADPSFFEGVDRYVRGMEWENTFEEDLFVRGVPNFDFDFKLEEMTLQTTLHDKNYNHKFLNLGRKEMIGKHHTVEFFVSGRSLIRLEKKRGFEMARTEYFLKLGDLYVHDKRGDLECTRVYYAPTIDESMFKRVNKQ